MKKLASRKDSRVIDLLIAFGPEGYGIYALFIDYLKERRAFRSMADVSRIAYELHVSAETLRAIITDFGLFEIVDGEITVKDVKKRKAPAAPAPDVAPSASEEPVSECVIEPDVSAADSGGAMMMTASQKRRERRKRLRMMSQIARVVPQNGV